VVDQKISEGTLLELITGLDLDSDSLRKIFSRIEYKKVSFSLNDIFITTAWWTNSKAKSILRTSKTETVPIYYLVQDFEPIFYASSDLYAAALTSYREADHLIINSKSLAMYISDVLKIDINENFIFKPQYLQQIALVKKPANQKIGALKILIYGRPSVQRNLFLTLISSLENALLQLPDVSCDISSVGEIHDVITLKSGHVVKSLGKLSLDEYSKILKSSDLGISLMLSPHPSYPPLEMASTGMHVITNDYFGYKKSLESYFPNLFVVEPTVSEISKAIVAIITNNGKNSNSGQYCELEGNSLKATSENLIRHFHLYDH
jgi:glycosyltransferase involved in cell wall biosynthesis